MQVRKQGSSSDSMNLCNLAVYNHQGEEDGGEGQSRARELYERTLSRSFPMYKITLNKRGGRRNREREARNAAELGGERRKKSQMREMLVRGETKKAGGRGGRRERENTAVRSAVVLQNCTALMSVCIRGVSSLSRATSAQVHISRSSAAARRGDGACSSSIQSIDPSFAAAGL